MNIGNHPRDNRQVFFTISDADYAPMSLTMFESVRRYYPDADLFLFIIGTGTTRKVDGAINVVYIHDLVDDVDLRQRLAYYLAVELACSFRPQCFEFLFMKGYERAFYVDPDLYFFRRMTEVDELFDGGSINGIITPHILKSISEKTLTGDRTFLQCGIYNMGFLALKNSEETMRLLSWWRGKLKWACVVDWPKGLFVDQKWMDFLPAFFEGIHVLRLPTYNLAPWNSEHYEILSDGKGHFFLDNYETPVAFIHFSGVKRSKDHYGHMQEAYEFYLDELRRRRHVKLGFVNYSLRHKRDDLFLDRICSFLYKEYIVKTDDVKSDPYSSDGFFDFLHSKDGETVYPVYVQALFEVLPDIFRQTVDSRLSIDYDNLIRFINWNFDYDGVATLETIVQLRNRDVEQADRFQVIQATDSHVDIQVPNPKSPYHQAAISLPLTHEPTKSRRKVIFRKNRTEVISGSSRICLPHIDEVGEIIAPNDIKGFSEVWVPSASHAETLRSRYGVRNVSVVPRPVSRPVFEFHDVELPDDKFVVMMRHDFSLGFAGQDPISTVRSFKRAFSDKDDALLVCVALNSDCTDEFGTLAEAFENDDRLLLVRASSANEYYNYLQRAQCLVSLHQNSEMQYPLAEALSLGKYVVASAGGESASFMKDDNSFLIDSGSNDAKIAKAAKVLLSIYDDLALIDQRKKRARLTVQKLMSPHSIGWRLQERLNELEQTSRNPLIAFYLKNKKKISRSIEKKQRKIHDVHYRHQVRAVSQIWFRRMNRPAILE